MTKRELIEALAGFDDNEQVVVQLHGYMRSSGVQLVIQGAKVITPWNPDSRTGFAQTVGLVCHESNALVKEPAKATG